MTREEAIAIIRKEYLCVDRDCGIEKNCGRCDLVMPSKEPILEAFKMAIKALEQEPCGDAISRQAALDALRARFGVDFDYGKWWSSSHVMAAVESVPPVTPQEPKVGRWIPVSERLPEVMEVTCDGESWLESDPVLICGKPMEAYHQMAVATLYRYEGDHHRWDCADDAFMGEVTAWMPLPAPFEPQESEDKE